MLDLTLAVLHHLLVFGLVMMLAMELALLRTSLPDVRRLAGLDAGYGATALLVIVVGVCRVVWGGKGWAFYQANPFFWAKIGTFALIGLISVVPTLRILRWRRAGVADPARLESTRALVRLELLLVLPLVAFAAAMARWPF